MEVRILKLVTGEEIITGILDCLDDEGEKCYELHDPMVLMMVPEGLAILPYIPPYLDDSVIKIRTNHMLYPIVPNSKLIAAYNEQVETLKRRRSDIIQPPKGLILPE